MDDDPKEMPARMNFVFYDIETTGTDISFDQIVQFAAILTDSNLHPLDRFDGRCRRLPWVVPSPSAMLVTGVVPKTLDDKNLLRHAELIELVRKTLISWSPAIFIGYNSMRFDEPILQRALWQTLFPPYLTVTGGNSRFDVLPLARFLAHLKPLDLPWPINSEGQATFRLDKLAPQFGFDHSLAHNAVADVHATIHIAKLFASKFPDIWTTLISRTSKAATIAAIESNEPVLFFERTANNSHTWWGQRIDRPVTGTQAIIVDLAFDWEMMNICLAECESGAVEEARKFVRRVSVNKAPVAFTRSEAEKLFGIRPDERVYRSSAFIGEWEGTSKFASEIMRTSTEADAQPKELEEMIHYAFASRHDEALMYEFHKAPWTERPLIARSFDDRRFRALAIRLIYDYGPELLDPVELRRVRLGINNRLFPPSNVTSYSWRSVEKAEVELQALMMPPTPSNTSLDEIKSWIDDLRASSS